MDIAILGSCGHYNYIRGAAEKRGCRIVAATEGVRVAKEQTPAVYPDSQSLLAALENGDVHADIAVVNDEFWMNSILAIKCMEAGCHIFLEKPAATDLYRLAALREMCARHPELVLTPMFGIRAESAFITAKRLVSEGAVGRVRMLDARKSYKMGKRPAFYTVRTTYGGIIPWVAIHAIDWVRWLSGAQFESVVATHSTEGNRGHGDMEVSSTSFFRMSDGISAVVCADMLRPDNAPTHGDDRIRVVGTDGVLEVREGRVYLINENHSGALEQLDAPGDIFDAMCELIEAKKSGRDASALMTRNDYCSAEDAFAATEAALLARESADTGEPMSFITDIPEYSGDE
jgi:predicted dehydrogenase